MLQNLARAEAIPYNVDDMAEITAQAGSDLHHEVNKIKSGGTAYVFSAIMAD